MSTYLNRNSLVGCAFAIGLSGGVSPMLLAADVTGEMDPSMVMPSRKDSKPSTTPQAKPAKSKDSPMDHSKMDHGSMGTMDHSKCAPWITA